MFFCLFFLLKFNDIFPIFQSLIYRFCDIFALLDMDCMGHTSVNLEDANGSLPFYQYNCFADRSYHLAITGKSFALVCEHYPELLEKVSFSLLILRLFIPLL